MHCSLKLIFIFIFYSLVQLAFFFLIHSLIHSLLIHWSSSLSVHWSSSLKLTLTAAGLTIVNVIAIHHLPPKPSLSSDPIVATDRQRLFQRRPKLPIAQTNRRSTLSASDPPPSASDPRRRSECLLADVVLGDFLYCLWLVILFGLGWEKDWRFGFFFLLWTGGGCGCGCDCGWW